MITGTRRVIRAFGVMVEVQLPERQGHLDSRLGELWRRCAGEGEPDLHLVVDEVVTDAKLLAGLTQLVTVEAIGARAGELVMLHGCAVATSDGRSVALVGPSGMGKTTAALTLGRQWAYVTDETVAIDVGRTILPYPKPLAIVDSSGPKRQMSPDELNLLSIPAAPLRLAATVLLERVADLREAEVRPIPTVEALALVAPHSSYLSQLKRPLHRLADALGDDNYVVRYTDAEQLVSVVAGVLGDPAQDGVFG